MRSIGQRKGDGIGEEGERRSDKCEAEGRERRRGRRKERGRRRENEGGR